MRLARMLVAMLSLATAGCAGPGQGMLYTRVVSPYSTDFHATPAGSKTCRVHEHIFKDPVGGTHVSVDYTLRVVQESARDAGITNLYYGDLETLSVLGGMYERKTLILSGD
jgi:hypothetical protein